MVTRNIQSDILLELAFISSNETNEDAILKKAIPLYLRKLNCFVAAVLKNRKYNELEESILIPIVSKNSEEWKDVKEYIKTIVSDELEPCAHWTLNSNNYYVFTLKNYGLLVLGKKKPIETTLLNELKPIIDHLGKNLTFAHEITQRIKAEELIHKQEQSLYTLSQSTAAGILIHQGKNIIYSNYAAEQITGYKNSELLNLNILDLVHPEFIQSIKDNSPLNYFKNHKIPHYEIVILKKNGRKRWIDVRAGHINWMGVDSVIISAFDITKRKAVEVELIRAKEEAEKSEQLKSAFLANMSHEIRTPMNGILGFADLLKTPNLPSEKQLQYINIIKKSGERLLNLINDIVDISKIEANLMKTNLVDVAFNPVMDYLFLFFNQEAISKGIQLTLKKGAFEENAKIKTDKEKFCAILLNLIKNAIKYTNEGTIEFGYKLTTKEEVNYLEFYVKDTGIGVPKNRQKAIFERFIQADIKDKNALQGAGLGLSISKAYVEMLGGELFVKSTENKGSKFYFTLPYSKNSIEPSSKKEINIDPLLTKGFPKLKILIVEDDDISKQLAITLVSQYSKEILQATNGMEAIKICKDHTDVDLILMDIKMPILNGIDATKEIRTFNKDVIIIALTAHSMAGDKEKTLNAGCNDYISKPLNKNEIKNQIEKYFFNS